MLYGYIAHYTIDVVFALMYVLGWDYLIGGPISPIGALAYGIVTTAGSLFFIYPSTGSGMLGSRTSHALAVSRHTDVAALNINGKKLFKNKYLYDIMNR